MIKVYVPERDSDPLRASILAANTEIFYAIGRPFMPLWVGLNACDKPIIMLGELDEHDIQQLKDRDRAGCINDQPARDNPRTGMSVPFLI